MADDVAFQISTKIINTAIIVFVIFLTYLAFRYWIKSKELETKTKYKKRFLYASGIILTYFIGKIWMEGFIHLFAFLGIVSAALTITQKETLMNLMGWLIIMWRDHFSEGDRIEIASYKGYVHSIGVFYFTMSDEYTHHRQIPHGKTFRIPNGLVITSPITNHMRKVNSMEFNMTFLITPDSSLDEAMTLMKSIMQQVLTSVYLKKEDKDKKPPIFNEASVYVRPKFEEPSGIEINLCYYCLPRDQLIIEKQAHKMILEQLQKTDTVHLAFGLSHKLVIQRDVDFDTLSSKKLIDFQKSIHNK
ncbi:MAG: mechanosensitive ion channel family protein [Alphaproteobacteria bacterium]|nr:mechanosensitive ion channel family protein [Alphaproteobacteria bacterium]MBX9976861.1 mechanosensitive ion channel family protein [Alphaproteobacteria bacterium]